MTRLGLLTLAFSLMPAFHAAAQGTKADYARSANLEPATRDKIAHATVEPHWIDGGRKLWYRDKLVGDAGEFILVDCEKPEQRPAFDHAKLANGLSLAAKRRVSPERLPFREIEFNDDLSEVRFEAFGQPWRCKLGTYEVFIFAKPASGKAEVAAPDPGDPKQSPDGTFLVQIQDFNVVLKDQATGEVSRLTTDGSRENAYTNEIDWSPDSSHVVVMRVAPAQEHKVYMVESSPADQVQPKLKTINYLKPGDVIDRPRPYLFDVKTKKSVPVSDELFKTPWSIDEVHWTPDSSRFLFLYNQRGHQVMRVVSVDAASGKARAIVDEHSDTFIDYSSKTFLRYLDRTDELLWMSERDGWNHIYLYDSKSGKVKRQVTKGPWVVRKVEEVDEDKREIRFTAMGIDPKQDPYYLHYCRIGLDDGKIVRLTDGDGTHDLDYSPDHKFYVDHYSRVDLAPVAELRRTSDGSLVLPLATGDWSELTKTGWRPPERFTAMGRDGKTPIYGVIFRPTNFDPAKKYPVLEDIYAGPQDFFVPKEFNRAMWQQRVAELGFIVVKIDGMGTNWRSRAFHDVCYKNLADSGFPDRIPWLKAAAKKHPEMDLSRVGLFGTSAGGQSALAGLLWHGDFYKAAVANCGCHDNRMDKIWWNEQWMGWPVDASYAENSNVTHAANLTGSLLLIVGELDTNVDPASTMQVVDALIKADKDFDLLVVPGAGHGAGSDYTTRRTLDFLVRHVMGVEPRRE